MKHFFLSLLFVFCSIGACNRSLSIQQEAVVTYIEIMLVNYLESKYNKPDRIKEKIRDILNQTNDNAVLGYVYEIVSGLTLIYDDVFTKELQIRLEEWERHTHLSLSDILKRSRND